MLNRQSPSIFTALEPCRLAPYVNKAKIQSNAGNAHTTIDASLEKKNEDIASRSPGLSSDSGKTTFSAFDPAIITAAANKYAALMENINTRSNIFAIAQCPLNLAAVQSKSSSIADLRMKAKRHAELFGVDTKNED